MFRDFTQRNASKLGLVGTVKNLNDGTVEVVARGEEASLRKLIEKLQKGSVLSRVDNLEVTWKDTKEPQETYTKFMIIYE